MQKHKYPPMYRQAVIVGANNHTAFFLSFRTSVRETRKPRDECLLLPQKIPANDCLSSLCNVCPRNLQASFCIQKQRCVPCLYIARHRSCIVGINMMSAALFKVKAINQRSMFIYRQLYFMGIV